MVFLILSNVLVVFIKYINYEISIVDILHYLVFCFLLSFFNLKDYLIIKYVISLKVLLHLLLMHQILPQYFENLLIYFHEEYLQPQIHIHLLLLIHQIKFLNYYFLTSLVFFVILCFFLDIIFNHFQLCFILVFDKFDAIILFLNFFRFPLLPNFINFIL